MLIIVMAFLFTVILVLTIPLDLDFSFAKTDHIRSRWNVIWMFGLVRINVHSSPAKTVKKKSPSPVKAVKKPKSHRRRKRVNFLAALQSKGFIHRIMLFITDIIRAFRIRKLSCSVKMGLDDPADTGQLWGVVGPVAACLYNVGDSYQISVEPDFNGICFTADCYGNIRLLPIQVIVIMFGFLFSPANWRAFIRLYRGH